MPPVVGLYATPGALILYAVFGSSKHLITGPMSATAALSGAAVAQLATPGSNQFVTLTVALALTAGVIALVAGMLDAIGVKLLIAHDVGGVRDTLRETGAAATIDSVTYPTVDEAVAACEQAAPPAAPAR